MTWSPSARELVMKAAWPVPSTATGEAGPPATGTPCSVNVTVPMVTGASVFAFFTVAVIVTGLPEREGFRDEASVVVVGVPVAGVMLRHQPLATVTFDWVPPLSYRNSDQSPLGAAPLNAVVRVRALAPPPGEATENMAGTCGAGDGGDGIVGLSYEVGW